MKKILILGTGNAQVDIIEYCKEAGFEVHACSYTTGGSGEKLVDKFELINIIDIDGVEKYVKDNNIDYVYSAGSDVAMPTACIVSERLGLPHFVSSKTALLCNTKNELRKYLKLDFEGNIKFQEITNINDEIHLEFPLIMKPVDSQGQRGVTRINSLDEFKEKFESSMKHSRVKRLIVEEYIEGPEISVNSYSINNEVVFSLISDRIVFSDLPGGIIHKHLIPTSIESKEIKNSIEDLVKRVLEKLEIKNGPAYFQIKMKNGIEPKLIEVTPRLDGCHMWRLIKKYTGNNLLDWTIKHIQGNLNFVDSKGIKPLYKDKKFVLEFLCEKPGLAFNKEKYDVGNSSYLKWYYENGDIVKSMNGYMEKCGYMIKEWEGR
ncbi:ATP-grasp domain-containing protein [Clostridium sp. SYSU_GA19001]|uniref:ATP-grasp domain-containing protein n=1 Tax=Clostridium caldaquaticum TaxID=2940653 RepID=UPI0020770D8D|nr:ATP-grasp domain-containing protein [Clostridium caldaquaticum]MCM8710187.1 ATP-grasp domain-containing protein [Clostridium caldaquaticum]